ncbi:hypothetical protein GCM10027605_52910 [Micromonospora zhanjiangensis]
MSRPTSAQARLARYGFGLSDGERTGRPDGSAGAADLLGPDGLGLWRLQTQEPVDEPAADLLTALSRAADPDLALRQLHRIVEAERRLAGVDNGRNPAASAGTGGQPATTGAGATPTTAAEEPATAGAGSALIAALHADPGLRRRLIAVLGASSALGDHLVANPDQWRALSTVPGGGAPRADGDLDPETDGRTGTGTGGNAPIPALRRAYRLALLRVAAADLTGASTLEQTMAALSRLADATLAAAYDLAVAELPAGTSPPRLAVVAMGKCGGGELNYVSDVDVIFVADTDEDLTAATTVATRLIHVCGLVAWPVDAALRPEGSRGPLVRTLASHLAYYRRWARTWEFQALLKARPAAGDLDLAAEWIDQLSPLVWHAAERPEAVEDVRAMRRRIIDNIPPRELEREIKRGPGGLRDIEFAVQLLQLVHGRGDESLRVPGTIPALRALVGGGTWAAPTGRRCCAATGSCARSSTGCSCRGCGGPTPCRPSGRRCAGWPTRSATPRCRAGTRSRRSAPTGSATPPRYAGCTPSCSTARCWRRWPGCPPKDCGSPRRRPADGWRSSASPTRPGRCGTSRRSPAG